MCRVEKRIDLASWNRKEHFEHFSAMDDPFFGVTVNVDCTKTFQDARESGLSFSLLVLHRILSAACKVEEFRYRIEGDKVVCYESLIPEITVGRKDNTFSFGSLMYYDDANTFVHKAKEKMEHLQQTQGLNKNDTGFPNAIHYSAVPWIVFTDMKHPVKMHSGDSHPKISTGKFFPADNRLLMPISITCHHGLMDGYHVGRFLELLEL